MWNSTNYTTMLYHLYSMIYYDSHTHLNSIDLYPARQEYIQRFADVGWKGLVTIGVDREYNRRWIEITQQSKILFPELQIGCTLGIHPCTISEENLSKADIDAMTSQINTQTQENSQYIWWIGECGTDLYRPCTPDQHQMQQYAITRQAELCQEYKLPLIIHSRSDWQGTYDTLNTYQDIIINLHCRNYGPDQVKQALDTWWDKVFFWYGWILTYPKAQEVRDSLIITPLSQIVIETDAPFLPPQAHRGGTNYPHYIVETYQKASEVLAIDVDDLCTQIESNWKKLYQKL